MSTPYYFSSEDATALFIGRFQPFHNGHYQTLKTLYTIYKEVIIGIGSAQESHTQKNPFTVREREEMILRTLSPKEREKTRIVAIPDINDDNRWVSHVQHCTGNFSIVFTNNDLVSRLFTVAGISVIHHQMIRSKIYNGTAIRSSMLSSLGSSNTWKDTVPTAVYIYLESIYAVDRLVTIHQQRDSLVLARILSLDIKNEELWKQAFIHKSYCSERNLLRIQSNERLEFLGDAVLELIISEHLFQAYPTAGEGDMTTQRAVLVRTDTLVHLAKQLNLGYYVMMSYGEEKNGGRYNASILANVCEALVGALFIEKGLEATKKFIVHYLLNNLPVSIAADDFKDSKTKLQEFLQEKEKLLPVYELVDERGQEHEKIFTYVVKIKNKVVSKGHGKTKQQAQQVAAAKALERLIQ